MRYIAFILLPLLTFAQTSFTDADIRAAASNKYETLLIGIPATYASVDIQGYTYQKWLWEAKSSKCGKGCYNVIIENDPVGTQQKRKLSFKVYYKKLGGEYTDEITTKIVFTGDLEMLISFYTEFWSRTLNFTDIKPGEVVSTRFLTDVATFSFDDQGNPRIVVESAKDR